MRKIFRLLSFLKRNQNLILVSCAFLGSLGIAVTSGNWFFYRATYILGGLMVLGYVWARSTLNKLDVTVDRLPDRLQVGQLAGAHVYLANESFFGKQSLELEYHSEMPGKAGLVVLSVPGQSREAWNTSIHCSRRGTFKMGPLTIQSGDPFGLFRVRRHYGEAQTVLVYPSPKELPYFAIPPAHLSGGERLKRQAHHLTPNAASVRDYEPGDSLNRIHWRTTARVGRLMVKTFDTDPSSQVWIVLDLEKTVQAGGGEESTEEYGVDAACSVAHHFLAADRAVGLVAYGRHAGLLDPARGPVQYDHILETLAMASAEGTVALADVLAREARRFNKHTTLVVITPSPRENWVAITQDLVQHGARMAVVLMDGASFGGKENSLLAYGGLVAGDVPTYLLRCGDDLSLALGPQGASNPTLLAQESR